MTITALEGTANFRDTGGLPLTGGGSSAPGVLYRSDALSALTPRGLDSLAESRIEVIIDLRTPAEQLMAPDRLPPARSFTRLNLPLFEGAFTGAAQEEVQRARQAGDPEAAARAVQAAVAQLPTLAGLYTEMLQDGSAVFAEIARAVAGTAEGSAVLVHCTAGKDRTGVAVALMLLAAGAEPEAVTADYRRSEANLSGEWANRMLGMIKGLGVPMTDDLVALVTGAPEEAITGALEWVREHHGDAGQYLLFGGLHEDELAMLRRRLRMQP